MIEGPIVPALHWLSKEQDPIYLQYLAASQKKGQLYTLTDQDDCFHLPVLDL